LKDKFLTQSVPDICRKLQKLVAERSRDLVQLVCVDTSVYYDRDLEKEKKDLEREKRKDKQEALIVALREVPQGRVKTQGYVFNVDSQAILGGSVPRGSHVWDPAPFAGEIIERPLSSVPRGTKARASHLMTGPRASYPGSCDHHKSRGTPGDTYY
jgi:hypothetical protein